MSGSKGNRNETTYKLVLKINEIQPDQWDEFDERDYRLIDAVLRRAKAEGAREMIKIVKANRADQRVADDLNNTVSLDSFNEVLDAITREIDARAAQIEEGE